MINGSLFTEEFLKEGITSFPEWNSITTDEVKDFKDELKAVFDKFPTDGNPLESTTENDLIEPVIKALGWNFFLTQQTTAPKGRDDVPDYLLFDNEDSKNKANKERDQYKRYVHGTAILEAKPWNVRLDRKGTQPMDRVPSNQIIRYLTSADTQSDGRIQWGILTNGRFWRLYYNRAKSKSEDYLEIDLPLALGLPGFQTDPFSSGDVGEQDWLKVFYLLFRRDAFLRQREEKTFHEQALERGRFWESKVADDLSDIVFKNVFPALLTALKDNDPQKPNPLNDAYLDELRDNALTLLYRLLFVLYAEDRNLLPVYDSKYDDYGFRKRIRENIEKRMREKDIFSESRDDYYHNTLNLFESINKGDESIGLPPYNGGLFDSGGHRLLSRARIPDKIFAPIIYKLSHLEDKGVMKWINYRDLSVQQLGSIYERLLEFYPKLEDDGSLAVSPNIFARKTSGSYYTPESLVGLIIERAVGPLLKECKDAFLNKVHELKKLKDKKMKSRMLESADPATAMLDLKICDPAMGSGHFLVSLVDYLADNILETIDEVETEGSVPWADKDNPYVSPVSKRIASIRALILEQANEHGWNVKEEQLDDKQVVRRMILKRCVYGVDKNPMAVELAKVSLWLHTFTVGAPLSFLDHHLRCGDSLFGEWVGKLQDELNERGVLFSHNTVIKAQNAAAGMLRIEQLTDADISEVKQSASMFEGVEEATAPLNSFLQLYHAFKWIASSPNDKVAVDGWLFGDYGDPYQIAEGKIQIQKDTIQANQFKELLAKARDLIEEEHFLNWEVAFPGVWKYWERHEPEGGFDAVIGNPPWDRMKLQQVEWFADRKPEIAMAARAADRKRMIEALKNTDDPLWKEYEKAVWHAEVALERARKDGQYPLMATGDFNIYALFVERAERLLKDQGYVGLVVPVGIAYDKGNSKFFGMLSETQRIQTLFVFENRGGTFFNDVHHEDKPTIFVFGGKNNKFDDIKCAFFIHQIEDLDDPDRCFPLNSHEFALINPNTKTAPIFRNRRDAQIVGGIYIHNPILIDRRDNLEQHLYDIKYFTMFHMTNDSNHFVTPDELNKLEAYPVGSSIYKYPGGVLLPLYEGKMIDQYNHRYASIKADSINVSGQGVIIETQLIDLQNPEYMPVPRYWVDAQNITFPDGINWVIGFRDTTNVNNWRTTIASIVPKVGHGNTLPLLIPNSSAIETYIEQAPLLIANMNSFSLDYISRQKIQARHLNAYILEQLPFIDLQIYKKPLGNTTVAEFIKEHVLHLTYTAWDMQPFARDMGYDGEPFIWDEEDRRHRMAKLDALFFNLYEISEDDADYILSTFPIVKRHDEQEHGRFLTCDLILAYMRALKAGDTEVIVKA